MNDALRTRLESLNRGPLPAVVRVAPPPTVRGGVTGAAAKDGEPSTAWRAGVVHPIPGLVRRGEIVRTDCGEHLRICLPLDDLWQGGVDLVARRCVALRAAKPASDGADVAKGWWDGVPDAAAFLDLETCGLAGSALFLAGLLRPVDGQLAVELLLARDYSEESAVLASLWQRLADVRTIVTFNGKSFDWPMVVDRSRRHLLRPGQLAPAQHVDLLHLARRRWRGQVVDCKLQTLERQVCNRLRTDDMPSSQIPAAYQQYVRTGFEREMDAILMHNALDLVTMLDLAMRLAG